MELYIFNRQFEFLGIVDDYNALIVERNLTNVGKFTLTAEFTFEVFELLSEGNIFAKSDNVQEAYYICSHEIEEEGTQEKLTVKGFSIENLLARRIVWRQQRYDGDIDTVMKSFVKYNVITPENPKRILPNFSVSPPKTFGETSEVCSYKPLVEILESTSLKNDVGWRVLFDINSKEFKFDVFRGEDLSINQNDKDPVIFSTEYENVVNQKYVKDSSQFANMVLVAGAGEGEKRKIELIRDDLSGWERVEMFVDARDLSDQDEDGNVISTDKYQKMLKDRGLSKLAEAENVEAFEGEVDSNSQFIYRKDFDLGDRVTVLNKKWGIVMHPRITSVTEEYENGILNVNVEFGTNKPTLIDTIKRKIN
ncbi:siphovirus ReqiPepy6 Gp37-like family protein [Bacillus sp. JJ1127]|uniref:siphovirus ReqiPepy6 Gp37-like family protein n=1 Tax=Bacillus sp. JJ1127 TaxID=3122952 RepID=UPI002FFFAAA1